jgi:hypothetical protein
MYILRIEHPVDNFNSWKEFFDNDPVDRKTMGVRRHSIFRSADDPEYVLIDLEFDSAEAAESMADALYDLWENEEGKLMFDAELLIVEEVETKEY